MSENFISLFLELFKKVAAMQDELDDLKSKNGAMQKELDDLENKVEILMNPPTPSELEYLCTFISSHIVRASFIMF